MDWLETAKERYDKIRGVGTAAVEAQAAAMIAIAERLDPLIDLLSRVAVSSTVHVFSMEEDVEQ